MKLIFVLFVSCGIVQICRSDNDGNLYFVLYGNPSIDDGIIQFLAETKSPCNVTSAMTATGFCQRALLNTEAVYSALHIQLVATLSCCSRFALNHCLPIAIQTWNCTGREDNLKTTVVNIKNMANGILQPMSDEDCPPRDVLGDENGICHGVFGFFNSAIRQIKNGELVLEPGNMTIEEAVAALGQPPRSNVFSLLEEYIPEELMKAWMKLESEDRNSTRLDFVVEELSNETDSERGARCLASFPEFNSSEVRDSWLQVMARYNEFVANSSRDFMKTFNETVVNENAFFANSTRTVNEWINARNGSAFQSFNRNTAIENVTNINFAAEPFKNATSEIDVPANNSHLPLLNLASFDSSSNDSTSNPRPDGSRSLDEVEDVLWEISNRSADSELEFEDLNDVSSDSEEWVLVAVIMALNETSRDSRCLGDPTVWKEVMARYNVTENPALNRLLMALPNATKTLNGSDVTTFGRSLDGFEDFNRTSCAQANRSLSNFINNTESNSSLSLSWNEISNDSLDVLERVNDSNAEEKRSRDARSFLSDYNAYVKEMERQYNESLANMTRFFDSFKLPPLPSFNFTPINPNPFPAVDMKPLDTSVFPSFNFTPIITNVFGNVDPVQPLIWNNNSLNFTDNINGSTTNSNRESLRDARSFLSDYNAYIKDLERQYNESVASMTRFFNSFNTTPFQFPAFNTTAFQFPTFNATTFQSSSFNTTPFQFPTFNATAFQLPSFNTTSFQFPTFNGTAFQLPSFNTTSFQFPTLNMTPFQSSGFNTTSFQFPAFNMTPLSTVEFPRFDVPTFNASLFPNLTWPAANPNLFSRFAADPIPAIDTDLNPIIVDPNFNLNSTNVTRTGARSLEDGLEKANETECTKMEERLETFLQSFAVNTSNSTEESFILEIAEANVTTTVDHHVSFNIMNESNAVSEVSTGNLSTPATNETTSKSTEESFILEIAEDNVTTTVDHHVSFNIMNESNAVGEVSTGNLSTPATNETTLTNNQSITSEDDAKRGRSLWENDLNSTEAENASTWDLGQIITVTDETPVANVSRDSRQLHPISGWEFPTIPSFVVGNQSTSPAPSSENVWIPKNYNPKESDLLNAIREINASSARLSLAQLILIVNVFSLILINF